MIETESLIFQATDLVTKIKLGLELIKKARAEGKEVAEWEKAIEQLQAELDAKLEEIAERHPLNTPT